METIGAEPIVVSFDNSLQDHLHANRLYRSRSFFAKIDKIVAALLLLFGIWAVSSVGVRWWTVIFFPLSVAEWFDLLSISPLQVRIFYKRNPKLQERYTLEFGEAAIHFKTATIDSKLEWSHYNGLLESDRVLLLTYGRGMYTVVPKSAFRDGSQIEQFRTLVKRKVGL